MVKLICEASFKALLALAIAWPSTTWFEALAALGGDSIQATIVLAFYLYCFLALFFNSNHKVFHVLSIPVLTQFLHLFQKYDFPAGANSLWRLMPFLFLDMYLFNFILRHKSRLDSSEKLLTASWLLLHFIYLIISPNLSAIIAGAFTLFLVTIPMYYIYLNALSKIPGFDSELEKSLCMVFLILAVGTFGLVFAGARYKGSDNLLVTRNISDTNVTMAYFVLLWPFVLLFFRRLVNSSFWIPVMTLIFAGVVLLSFSRGAVFIVSPYLASSILLAGGLWRFAVLMLSGVLLVPYAAKLVAMINEELAYSWQLRFADFQYFTPALQQLQEASGRSEIRSMAYRLFLDSPVYGHGIGSFEVLGPGYREAHSMFFTLLAEQGLVGAIYVYSVLTGLGYNLFQLVVTDKKLSLLLLALIAYLVFVHSVGSVFVIIPARSVTINCIAPILLLSLHFYGKNIRLTRHTDA
nr:O-antigen ligase family protein [uncultured Dyadobacter sp.]